MVKIAGGKSVVIPTDEKTGFKITAEMLSKSLTEKTKLLIVCNPSNPTGSVYSKDEILKLSEVIEGKDIFILSDEIYEKIIYDNFEYFSFASASKKIKERTITINGCSKTYSMTGWRLGYAAANSEIIKAMAKYQSHNTGNTSSISQAAALEALTGDQTFVKHIKKEFEKRRDYLHEELSSIENLICFKPSGAFYFFPNVKRFFGKTFSGKEIKNSEDLSLFLLQNGKVATVPGTAFGLDGYIRISYSTSIENLIEATKRIKESLSLLK